MPGVAWRQGTHANCCCTTAKQETHFNNDRQILDGWVNPLQVLHSPRPTQLPDAQASSVPWCAVNICLPSITSHIDPWATPYTTLRSVLKSLTTPSSNATASDSRLLVATSNGFSRAASSLLVMLRGVAVKFATAEGLGSLTATEPCPVPSTTELLHTDQELCRYCWQGTLVPTCGEGQ